MSKIAERMARERAEVINGETMPFIPHWHSKLMGMFNARLVEKLFGYILEVNHGSDKDTYTFKRRGKILNKFAIRETIIR